MAQTCPEPLDSEARSSVWPAVAAGLLLLVAAWPLFGGSGVNGYVRGIVILAGINITLAVSLNLVNGVTGQFSIGHAGFMAVGAYVAAAVTVFGGTALERWAAHGALDPAHPVLNLFLVPDAGGHVPVRAWLFGEAWFVVALLAGGAAAALAGVVVGIPTLRLRGDYLAIATLGFSEIVRVGLLNLEVMGGASGFNGIAPFGRIPSVANYLMVYGVALGCITVMCALNRSKQGRGLRAIREDEVAAEAVGIDTTRFKVRAFALSAFFAGLAGGLLAHDQGNLNPSQFSFLRSIEFIAMVVLGGNGSITGCVIAAVMLTGLREGLRELSEYRMVLYAEILLVMMLVRRQGLMAGRELTAHDLRVLWYHLRQHGGRGVVAWLRGAAGALGARWRGWLVRPGCSRFDAGLSAALLVWPLFDLLAGWLLPPSAQPYPRTYAAEIVASLTQLVHQGLLSSAALAPVASQVQFPLSPDLGLSVALLLLVLPWSQWANAIAQGQRRAAWWLEAGLLLVVWHGGGLWLQGERRPRTAAEVVVAGALLVVLLVWHGRRRPREGR